MSSKEPETLYKEEEFEEFVRLLDEGTAAHWVEIANALGVSPNTITSWKKRPEAQKAIKDGINKALKGMEIAGAKDWRMYEAKLKMLGINPVNKIEAVIDDPRKQILDKYLGGSDAGQTPEA